MAFNRQAQLGHASQHAGAARCHHADLLGSNEALRGLDAEHLAAIAPDAGHLALLNDVDTMRVGPAGKAPRDSVMPRRTAPALERCAKNWIARAGGNVNERFKLLDLLRIEYFAV